MGTAIPGNILWHIIEVEAVDITDSSLGDLDTINNHYPVILCDDRDKSLRQGTAINNIHFVLI